MYPNQNRAAMFSVVMEQKDVDLLQKAAVETDLYTDTIAKLIGSQPDVIHQEVFSSYQDKQLASRMTFERLKAQMEEKYVPEFLYGKFRYDWNITYAAGTMTVTLYDASGIELLKKHHIRFATVYPG